MPFTVGVTTAQGIVGLTQEQTALIIKEDIFKRSKPPQQLEPEEEAVVDEFTDQEKADIITTLKSISPIPPDAFDAVLQQQILDANKNEKKQRAVVERRNTAYRGITPKEESVASLRIIANLDLLSGQVDQSNLQAGGVTIYGTDQFILQNVAEPDDEKVQIVETFGEPVAFFYGRRPRMYSYSGILLNGSDTIPSVEGGLSEFDKRNFYSTQWRDNFKLAYELFLRGTKAARFRARAYLTYDRVIREGFIIRSSISQDIRPSMVNFMFSMFVTREINLDGVQAIESNTDGGIPAAPTLIDEARVLAALEDKKEVISIAFDPSLLAVVE